MTSKKIRKAPSGPEIEVLVPPDANPPDPSKYLSETGNYTKPPGFELPLPAYYGQFVSALDGAARYTPNYYSVRRMLADLIYPECQSLLSIIGDSRMVAMSGPLTDQNVTVWPWCGFSLSTNVLSSAGHTTTASVPTSDNTPNLAPGGLPGYASSYYAASVYGISMTGVDEPIAGNNIILMRALSADMSQANFPTLWGRLIADKPAVNITQNFYGQPLAPPLLPGWRQILRPAAATTSNAPGVVVGSTRYDFVNGDPYLSLNVLVNAGYDWETYNSIATEMTAVAGASTVAAQIIAACGGPIFVMEQPGLIRLSQAVGGRSIESFLNQAIFSNANLKFLSNIAEGSYFWLDIGTNNPATNTSSQQAAKLRQLMAEIRAVKPSAKFILTTAYPAQSDIPGVDPYYVAGAQEAAENTPAVLLVDTYNLVPSYAEGDALGYYADGVHYNNTGAANWLKSFNDRVVTLATEMGLL